jgi:hypothetical protein
MPVCSASIDFNTFHTVSIRRLLLLFVLPAILGNANAQSQSPIQPVTVNQILEQKKRFEDKELEMTGYVRLDRLSRRGFLYNSLADMNRRDYTRTIFLQLGAEKFTSLTIPDGSRVVILGYVDPKLHGPLGVYPAHVYVLRMARVRPSIKAPN